MIKTGQVRQQQVPMPSVYPISIGDDYEFMRNDRFFLFFSHIAYTLFYLILGIGFFRILGKQKTFGRENLRPLKGKGFITVANHCHIFDTVLTGLAVLPRRPWYASVQRNFEAPYFRKMFRILRGFPIPEGAFGLRKIMKPVTSVVKQGKIVHLFPEEELWHLYQELDFFQKGAFYLAHHANCPVVPMVHMFKPRKFFGKVLSKEILTIKTVVGPPIYPQIPTKEGDSADRTSVVAMCNTAHAWMKTMLDTYHERQTATS